MSCGANEKGNISKVSPILWQRHQRSCEIFNTTLVGMVVMTSNSHHRSSGSIPWGCQTYSPLVLQNWRVKTMGKGDHEVMCRWRQLALAE